MSLRAAALATPASATLVLLAVRGSAVLHGEGGSSFAVLAATGVAALVALAIETRRARTERAARVTAEAEAILRTAAALGDAAVACDPHGRIASANAIAVALAGGSPDALAARGIAALGDDLAVLLRGGGRGGASARVGIATMSGLVAARATVVRVPGTPPLDVVVARLDRTPPAPVPPLTVDDADIVGGTEPAPERPHPEPALGADLRAPLASAGAAAALLRMVLPRGHADAHAYLDRLERALREAETRLASFAAPVAAAAAAARPVDLDAAVSDALAGIAWPAHVRIRRAPGSAWALADANRLRQALRHVLRAAAAAMPAGGELLVRAGLRADAAVIEVAHTGAAGDGEVEVALAARLVTAQGGRLERAGAPRFGTLLRIELPPAPGRVAAAAGGAPGPPAP